MKNGGRNDTPDLSQLLGIDKVIHEPARLMILAFLSVVESADFIFLMNQTGLTQGNMSFHMAKLEESGYVAIKKQFVGKRPHTMISITNSGHKNMKEYLKTMKSFIDNF
jgi:DNA-binding transcriptional ArsR family regulator